MTRANRCEPWVLRRVPRTVDAKRKTAGTTSSAGHRPSAVSHEGPRSKRDRREAWQPAIAQHDLKTLKGKKPHERPIETGLTNVPATGKGTFAGSTGYDRPMRTCVLKRKHRHPSPPGQDNRECPLDLSNPATDDVRMKGTP